MTGLLVALLVLAAFAMGIGVDILLHRDKYRFREAKPKGASDRTAGSVPIVAGVALPQTLAYHPAHAWAFDAGNGRIRVGLDEFAASLVGKIERLEVPQRGRWFRQGEKGWTVVTAQGQVIMLAPAEGEVVAVNDQALANPEIVSQDPYGSGWLLEVFSPDSQVSFKNLLSGALARRWMEESIAELRQVLSPQATATALDGGRLAPRLGLELPPEQWSQITRRFFRS